MAERTEEFIQHLVGSQSRIYAYILSLLGNPDRADEVLSETNLVLWRKAEEFRPGTDFIAWSLRVAHFQVLAARQRIVRDKLVFDDALMERLADETADRMLDMDVRLTALRRCLTKISPLNRELLESRYGGESVQEIAARQNRSVGSISQTLYRLRSVLMDCIRQQLGRIRET